MNVCIAIPFPSLEVATLAYDVLSVDKDLKRSKVQRTLKVEDTILHVTFRGEELKGLRVAANAYIRNVKLIVKTVIMFNAVPKKNPQNA